MIHAVRREDYAGIGGFETGGMLYTLQVASFLCIIVCTTLREKRTRREKSNRTSREAKSDDIMGSPFAHRRNIQDPLDHSLNKGLISPR
jgi:hypothetical protein